MEYQEIIHRCFRCGFCKFTDDYQDINCPSYLKYGFDTFASGGRMWLIRAWLNEEIQNSRRYWDILYSCVTCGNCSKTHCVMPFNNDLLNIFEAAKAEQEALGLIPPPVKSYFTAVKTHGNPYGELRQKRGEWTEGTGIESYSGQEYLFYVGDVGSYDERGKAMAKSVASLLVAGGVSLGILGSEEESDGNDVKALGGKTLFRELAGKNIRTFREKGVRKIVTLDPHAFNVFTKEYPAMGGNFEVLHYTQVLARLVKAKKLALTPTKLKVTYHDPCYLGRHNGIYAAPRKALQAVPGLELVEMRRNRVNAFCCGGGGGNFFTDIIGTGEESPGRVRLKDALGTGADVIAVACPLCSKMLDDAIKAAGLEATIKVQDIAMILTEVLRKN
jgi:Fe-S oxidoreductase